MTHDTADQPDHASEPWHCRQVAGSRLVPIIVCEREELLAKVKRFDLITDEQVLLINSQEETIERLRGKVDLLRSALLAQVDGYGDECEHLDYEDVVDGSDCGDDACRLHVAIRALDATR